MKVLRTLMVVMTGLSLVLAASTAFADGKYRHGGPSSGAYPYGKHVYVERHAYPVPVAPRYAWGYRPAYPYRVHVPPVHREYCGPYPAPYAYAPAYRPGWSFGFSFGW